MRTIMAVAALCAIPLVCPSSRAEQPAHREPLVDRPEERGRVQIADRRAHLLEAATHLEAAGLTDEAKRLRDQVQTANELLLADKLRELQTMQEEVLRLKQIVGYADQFVVRVLMAEVDSRKLQELNIKLDDLEFMKTQSGDATQERSAVLSSDRANELVEQLKASGCLKVISTPSLITLENQSAWFASGGEVPVFNAVGSNGEMGLEYHKTGVEVWLTPRGEGHDRVRLESKVRFCALDHSTGIKIDDVEIPGFDTREMQCSASVGEHQSAVFLGYRRHEVQIVESHKEQPWYEALLDVIAKVNGAEESQDEDTQVANAPSDDAADDDASAQRVGVESETMLLLVMTPEFVRPTSGQQREEVSESAPPAVEPLPATPRVSRGRNRIFGAFR